ncbi:MAG: HEAT repeat domain-containing protein [Planctomycetota bacterium]
MKKGKIVSGVILGVIGIVGILFGCGESEKQKINRYINEMGVRAKSPARDAYSRMLVQIGAPAVEPLIYNLKNNPDRMIRAYSALTLSEIGDKSAEQPIKNTLSDKNPEVRAHAATALTKLISSKAIPNLIEMLKDLDATPRESAQNCLVKLGDVAIDPLIECLSQSNPSLRSQARVILGRMGRKTLPKLIDLLESTSDPNIQIITARTMADIGDKSVLDNIKKIADFYTGNDETTKSTRKSLMGAYDDLRQK